MAIISPACMWGNPEAQGVHVQGHRAGQGRNRVPSSGSLDPRLMWHVALQGLPFLSSPNILPLVPKHPPCPALCDGQNSRRQNHISLSHVKQCKCRIGYTLIRTTVVEIPASKIWALLWLKIALLIPVLRNLLTVLVQCHHGALPCPSVCLHAIVLALCWRTALLGSRASPLALWSRPASPWSPVTYTVHWKVFVS